MKKIFALTLAALLLVSIFAGCSLSPQTSESQVNVPVVTDIDREAVVATVGDKTVTMGDYIDLFDSYASYYTSYGYDLYSDPAALEEFQDFVIDILVEEQVIAYQAEQSGFSELSAEKLEEVESKVNEELEYLMSTYRPQAEEEAAADPSIDVEARTKELVEAESEFYTGKAMSYDEFVEWIREYYTETAISEMFREDALKDITVSDEAIQEWYDSNLESQTTT